MVISSKKKEKSRTQRRKTARAVYILSFPSPSIPKQEQTLFKDLGGGIIKDTQSHWRGHPTTNSGMQNGSSVGIRPRCVHVFACLVPICVLGRCSLATFLHRSSVGSLWRVRCWLGSSLVQDGRQKKNDGLCLNKNQNKYNSNCVPWPAARPSGKKKG